MDTLIYRLTNDYPDVTFTESDRFMFTPPNVICYQSPDRSLPTNKASLLLLHELSHYILHHQNYDSEIGLLKLEVQAWATAKKLIKKYQVIWDEEIKDDYLDSYRELLHRRSICPNCQINGFFSENDHSYHCPSCEKTWN